MALAALALLSLPWSSSSWAGKLEQIKKDGLRVCLEPGYMPFIMLDKQGKIIGFDPDLAELTAKELGAPKLEMINTPWNDIIPTLIADKCDIIMSGMSITEERRQKIDFSNAYICLLYTSRDFSFHIQRKRFLYLFVWPKHQEMQLLQTLRGAVFLR